ncbi:MAG: bacterioferritin [Anaerolineaceae bacterium]|jgi:bacterioferritin|nr:bacterioferritin [Anaerolineaceae bacterium]MDI9530213.1 bacterioferritin [Chloroflexota bacterium]HNZ16622.1 bacterioferritin [Anaerolineaceae bacterium]HOF27959.1 bacterioferritin [Anaerolineaceae bacterium]
MKGKPEIIDKLNFLLADELTAINQYFVHAEECGDWGYESLHHAIEERAIEEMKHAEKLISRILFLEGTPVVDKLNKMHIAGTINGMLENDHKAEVEAIANYNAAIKLSADLLDHGTKELLNSILKDEEAHLDFIEEQIDQIKQMGLEQYLTTVK